MSVSVEELLEKIDDMLDRAWNMPLSGGKCLIEAEQLRDILDDIRANLPSEIRQAKAIVNDRTDIVATARKEAESIIRTAEERARSMVSHEEVVRQAQAKAKEILAYELTKLVHGEDEAEKARQASKALFSGAGDTEHMPTTELTNDDFGGGAIDVLTLLVKCGLAASKGEARRLVQQGGVTVNDEKVSAIETTFGCEQFTGDGVIIKKGKKVFHRAVLV